MSNEQRKNLLSGTRDWSGSWYNTGAWSADGTHDGFAVMSRTDAWKGLYKLSPKLVAGQTYTFSACVKVEPGQNHPVRIYITNGNVVNDKHLSDSEVIPNTALFGNIADGKWHVISLTFTPKVSKKDVVARIEGIGGYKLSVCAYMLVEGTTPAAWAPAEGETLAGGSALMSANLWKAENVISAEAMEDGIYACSGTRGVRTNVSLDKLATNQTFHCGFSVNPGAGDTFNLTLCYKDAAGYINYASTADVSVPAGEWTRVSGSVVVPSGMTVYQMVICNNGNASGASGWKVTNPTLSLGSPVTLASSAHTPYATQDHVSVTYATKASLKVTDDSVKAEVSARAQTDQNVADLSSRLTQTANSITSEITQRTKTDQMVSDLSSRLTQTADGFSASIDRLSDTDKKVNSWFGFGADASGNPQLTMGSSTSPVVGVYTNTGLAYRSRSGATLLELDGASRSSTMPHVHADDVSMGNWQWMPTNNGTHFTLMWIGG